MEVADRKPGSSLGTILVGMFFCGRRPCRGGQYYHSYVMAAQSAAHVETPETTTVVKEILARKHGREITEFRALRKTQRTHWVSKQAELLDALPPCPVGLLLLVCY